MTISTTKYNSNPKEGEFAIDLIYSKYFNKLAGSIKRMDRSTGFKRQLDEIENLTQEFFLWIIEYFWY